MIQLTELKLMPMKLDLNILTITYSPNDLAKKRDFTTSTSSCEVNGYNSIFFLAITAKKKQLL